MAQDMRELQLTQEPTTDLAPSWSKPATKLKSINLPSHGQNSKHTKHRVITGMPVDNISHLELAIL